MSHVDEGALHAYLDGELPSSERATVEQHVAECATCRATLADERALRERASAVLSLARPRERPAPSLEQLRRASPVKRSPWHLRTAFAWAASIVLALGVGYLLRGPGTEFPAADKQRPMAAEPIVAQPIVVAENRSARALARSREKATTRRPPPAPTPADEIGRASEQSKMRADLAASTVAVTESARERAPDSLARDQSPVFRLDGVVVTGAARTTAGAAPGAAAPAPALAPARQRGSAWPVITRVAARALLGTDPVGLPGLPTRTIRLGPESGGVVVEQALDSATVIQIFQRPAGANAFADRDERVRSDRLARFIGGLRVEIAGPVSLDSLNRLLNQVRPLP